MKALGLAIAGCALSITATANADVLFNNFGSGDSYQLDRGWTMSYGGPLGGDVFESAMPFTITGGDYYLDSANVAVLHNWGPDLVYADIRKNQGGAPGAILESTSGTGVTTPFVWSPPMELTFSGTLRLEEGRTYWLALKTPEEDALTSWAFNDINQYGTYSQRLNGGPWNVYEGVPGTDSQQGVYRINGTPAPAPAALALLGIAAIASPRRRRG